MNNPSPAGANAPPALLYVVLHGLISLVDHGDHTSLTGYLIDMGSDHRYMAGTWLNEQPITSGSHLQLLIPGTAGGAELNPTQNPVLRASMLTSALKSFLVHSVVDLPRPDEILYFTKGQLSAGSLQGDTSVITGAPQFLAGTKILKYRIAGPNFIRLTAGPPLWNCPALSQIPDAANPANTAVQLAVLHIYNQPVELVDAAHNVLEFNRASAFLGTKIQLAIGIPAPQMDAQPPLGMLEDELKCLAHREISVVRIVDHLRTTRALGPGQAGGCGSELCGCPDGHT
jgi:hypothetical protein